MGAGYSWSACRRVVRYRRGCIRKNVRSERREEAPSTYEAEGASQFHNSNSPIARTAKTCGTHHRRIANLDEHRSTRCPPSQKAPSQKRLASGNQRRIPNPAARLRKLPNPVPANPGVSPETDHHLWWRARFLPPPHAQRKSPDEPISRISIHPQDRPRYPHVRARYPPVVHRFIHTRRPIAGRSPGHPSVALGGGALDCFGFQLGNGVRLPTRPR